MAGLAAALRRALLLGRGNHTAQRPASLARSIHASNTSPRFSICAGRKGGRQGCTISRLPRSTWQSVRDFALPERPQQPPRWRRDYWNAPGVSSPVTRIILDTCPIGTKGLGFDQEGEGSRMQVSHRASASADLGASRLAWRMPPIQRSSAALRPGNRRRHKTRSASAPKYCIASRNGAETSFALADEVDCSTTRDAKMEILINIRAHRMQAVVTP